MLQWMGLHLTIHFFQSLPSTSSPVLLYTRTNVGMDSLVPLFPFLFFLSSVNRPKKTSPAWDYLLLTTYHAPSIPSGSYPESKFWILSFSLWHSTHHVMPRLHFHIVAANVHALGGILAPYSSRTNESSIQSRWWRRLISSCVWAWRSMWVWLWLWVLYLYLTLCPLCTVLIWFFA